MAAASKDLNDKRPVALKYGLVIPYLRKFFFEDREHMSNSEFYGAFGVDVPPDAPPNAHEVAMKFLKQVRDSNGYDVDCYPPVMLNSPFGPRDSDDMSDEVMRLIHFAIDKINSTGKSHVLVKLDKLVASRSNLYFLTFTVKEENQEEVGSAQLKTIRAAVGVPFGNPCIHAYSLEEWSVHLPEAKDSCESMESKKKETISSSSSSEKETISPSSESKESKKKKARIS